VPSWGIGVMGVRVLFPGLACWRGLSAAAATAIALCRFWQPPAIGGLGETHFSS